MRLHIHPDPEVADILDGDEDDGFPAGAGEVNGFAGRAVVVLQISPSPRPDPDRQ